MQLITYWSRASADDLSPVLHGAFVYRPGRDETPEMEAARTAAAERAASYDDGDSVPMLLDVPNGRLESLFD